MRKVKNYCYRRKSAYYNLTVFYFEYALLLQGYYTAPDGATVPAVTVSAAPRLDRDLAATGTGPTYTWDKKADMQWRA